MSKTTFQPPLRLTRGSDKILCWPDKIILPEIGEDGKNLTQEVPLPELDENLQLLTVVHEIGEIVRSIDGMAVVEDGDDVLVYGQRTMTVNHLPNDTLLFRGRVSLEGKPYKGTRTRIRVRLPDGRLATLEVLKCA